MATTTHHHNRACIAGNELDELCCSDPSFMDNPVRLAAADRFRVQTRFFSVNVFADSPEDAAALAFAATGVVALHTTFDPQVWFDSYSSDGAPEQVA